MYRDSFEEIRQRVSCLDAARHYGLTVNRSGFALCPWHSDKHPSLKLYDGDRGCWCFSCQHGGDVVELVSGLLGVSRTDAAKHLNRDFRLGLAFGRDRETEAQRRERERRAAALKRYKDFLRWLEDVQIKLCLVHRLGWLARSTPPEEMTEAEACAVRELPRVAWLLDSLASGEMPKILAVYNDRKRVEELCSLALSSSETQRKTA